MDISYSITKLELDHKTYTADRVRSDVIQGVLYLRPINWILSLLATNFVIALPINYNSYSTKMKIETPSDQTVMTHNDGTVELTGYLL